MGLRVDFPVRWLVNRKQAGDLKMDARCGILKCHTCWHWWQIAWSHATNYGQLAAAIQLAACVYECTPQGLCGWRLRSRCNSANAGNEADQSWLKPLLSHLPQ